MNPQKLPIAASGLLQQRLAEGASYAVLRRIAPMLRHDVAGLMQPISMLTTILQRRVHMADPDLEAIRKNLTSVGALVKEATAGCMDAIGWMVSDTDTLVGLRSAVNEAIKLLEPEFSATALELINGISDESAVVPQRFLRSVFMGALLAFCDQHTAGGALRVTLEAGTGNNATHDHLLLRMVPGDPLKPPASAGAERKLRSIDWSDIEAMAYSLDVTISRGDGWLTLGLPEKGLSPAFSHLSHSQ